MSFGIYVHWPYCVSKCPYCDYNAHVATHIDQARWRRAYERELRTVYDLTGPRLVDTVFFGGGTPSLMDPETIHHVLNVIQNLWGMSAVCEVTLEANPTTVDSLKFKAFRDCGVNRISLGVQSLIEQDLTFLGRNHDVDQAKKAIHLAQDIFPRMSFDVIYGRPAQTESSWERELDIILDLMAGHVSLYQLTIEEGTPLYLHHARGDFTALPNADIDRLYDLTHEIMTAHGYSNYEVSSFCKPGEESRHNLIYWRYHDYAGIGPGAHGRLQTHGKFITTRAHRAPDIWLERVEKDGHGYHPFINLTSRERLEEAVMMGLRLEEGIELERLKSLAQTQDPLNKERIKALISEGLLHDDPQSLRVTKAGRKCLNAVIAWVLQ